MDCRRDKVTAVVDLKMMQTKTNLEGSLLPLWWISHYGFLLNDWCRNLYNAAEKSRLLYFIRLLGISISLFILIIIGSFETVQLVREIIKPDSTIHSLIPNLMWFCNFPPALFTALVFIVRRQELLTFFKDWTRLEQQMVLKQKPPQQKYLFKIIYGVYGLMSFTLLSGISIILLNRMGASYLLFHIQVLWDTLTVYGITTFHFVSVFTAWYFVVLADLVPAWAFYHAGHILESLAVDFRERYDVRQLYLRYEIIGQLTERANRLFGWMIVINQSTIFFMNCAQLYTVLSTMRNADFDTVVYFFGFVSFCIRMLIFNLMAAHLSNSFYIFKNELSSILLSCNKSSAAMMSHDDFEQLKLFCIHMSPIVARPLNLYQINSSILLSIASLKISYVIVLLQSK